ATPSWRYSAYPFGFFLPVASVFNPTKSAASPPSENLHTSSSEFRASKVPNCSHLWRKELGSNGPLANPNGWVLGGRKHVIRIITIASTRTGYFELADRPPQAVVLARLRQADEARRVRGERNLHSPFRRRFVVSLF